MKRRSVKYTYEKIFALNEKKLFLEFVVCSLFKFGVCVFLGHCPSPYSFDYNVFE